MKVIALKSFTGQISMYAGEEREIIDIALVRDLTQAGYIEQTQKKRGVKSESKRDNTK